MANSTSYLVKTRNRCVVGVYGDTAGGVTFGITNSAFDATNYLDTRITNSSAALSKIVYGISGAACILRFGPTGNTSAFVLPANDSGVIDFERFTLHNNAQVPDGTFVVQVPPTTTVTAYLEFVPF